MNRDPKVFFYPLNIYIYLLRLDRDYGSLSNLGRVSVKYLDRDPNIFHNTSWMLQIRLAYVSSGGAAMKSSSPAEDDSALCQPVVSWQFDVEEAKELRKMVDVPKPLAA
ncbi:hypothetical protein GQ55_1G392500 [Panicum hallii var. hallii]|uniref:Uncharacterized protein n=1 Tax=Panicum hallii var. hallii TaxID=1504633 RepID=A0A2T7FC89_9POAL|nr:hypothetical protein GQ55_1G392500 [Panicum hallii var. hallii]